MEEQTEKKTNMDNLAVYLWSKKEQYINDRADVEQQWLKNLRQYRGVYDPDVLERIPKDKSRAYPRDTRNKVKGFVAKMIEMMFPSQERNWDLIVTPYPSLPTGVIREILFRKAQERIAIAEETGDLPPAPSSDEIEEAVRQEAEVRRERMKKKIDDQIMDSDSDWVSICKRVVRSGAIYGAGVVRSPMVRFQNERSWQYDPEIDDYVPIEKEEPRPFPEFVKMWDIYPDMSAPSWDEQEGLWERMVFSRSSLDQLKNRPGIKRDALKKFLRNNKMGNYTTQPYENALQQLNSESMSAANKRERRYEVFRWFGYCDAKDLYEAGVLNEVSEDAAPILADIWLLGKEVIYADLAPFGSKPSDVYHAYIYTEDEESGLTGLGMPEEMRDRQMSICAMTRALYDNVASSAGPIYEIAVDLLKQNSQKKSPKAFTVFEREGDGPETQYPAIRAVNTPPVIPMISEVIKHEREQFDLESNIPSWTMGNARPLGEAFRTSANMSQMTGGANMITKDHVRAFDRFTVSVINSFLQWNMEYNEDETIKGDYQVTPRGAISLVAKEVRGAALDQFMSTLSSEDRALLKKRETLVERLKARDLPIDLVVTPEEAEQILQGMQQQQLQAQEIEQGFIQAKTQKLVTDAEKSTIATERTKQMFHVDVAEAMARVQKLISEAKASEDKAQLEMMDRMIQGLMAQTGEPDE